MLATADRVTDLIIASIAQELVKFNETNTFVLEALKSYNETAGCSYGIVTTTSCAQPCPLRVSVSEVAHFVFSSQVKTAAFKGTAIAPTHRISPYSSKGACA